MTLVPASIKAPPHPQVNLMPPEVATRRARGRRRGAVALMLLMFVVLLAGAVYFVDTQKAAALNELEEAEAQGDRLRAEIAEYSEVPRVQQELKKVIAARQYAGASEILWGSLIDSLREGIPSGVSIVSINIQTAGLQASPTEDTGPFARPDIGVLTFSGEASSYSVLERLDRQLDSLPIFERVRVVGAVIQEADGTDYYEYTASLRINARALSGRFTGFWDAFEAFDTSEVLTRTEAEALRAGVGDAESATSADRAKLEAAEQREFIAGTMLGTFEALLSAQYAVVDARYALETEAGFAAEEYDRLVLAQSNALFDFTLAEEAFLVYQAWRTADDGAAKATSDLDRANLELLRARAALALDVSGAQEQIDAATAAAADAQERLQAASAARAEALSQMQEPYLRLKALVSYRGAEAALAAAEEAVKAAIAKAESGSDEDVAARDSAEEALRSAQAAFARAEAELAAAGVVIVLEEPEEPAEGEPQPEATPSPSASGGES